MDTLFYLVWKNKYLRGCIRNRVCQNTYININSVKDLQDDYKYLSLFTDKDKLENRIYIGWSITDIVQYNQYSSSGEFKHLVNDVGLYLEIDSIDFNQIPQGVHKLQCYFTDKTIVVGTLPQSLTEFSVYSGSFYGFGNTALDNLLSNLPSSVHKVKLPHLYTMSSRVELPNTLKDLFYRTKVGDIGNLVVDNNVYPNCLVTVMSLADLQWVHSQPWISQLKINNQLKSETLSRDLIPPHIKDLDIYINGKIEDGAFPESLTKLCYNSTVPIQRLDVLPKTHLTYLKLYRLETQLEKGLLPHKLESLFVTNYNLPLLVDVLPKTLTYLNLLCFNQELCLGVLPNSLKELSLPHFKQELMPMVLPSTLEILSLSDYKGTIVPNSLPSTLIRLDFHRFYQTLENAPQMNRLRVLRMKGLDKHVAKMISNTKMIKILCETISDDFNLQQSSIQNLEITLKDRIPLLSNFIPKQIKILQLYNFNIESNGLIPNSCIKLKTDIKDLDLNLIPSTTKHLNIHNI